MKKKTHTLKINEARAIALKSQLLDSKEKPSSGLEGVISTIRTLGYVQIDTISVVERAHHHVLWTRNKDYRKEMLHELQTKKNFRILGTCCLVSSNGGLSILPSSNEIVS